MTLVHHPPTTTTQTQGRQYLGSYWLDFDQTLKVGSWDHLEHIPTVTKISQQKFCWQKCSTKKNYNKKIFAERNFAPKFFCQQKNFPTKNICQKNFHWNWNCWKKRFAKKNYCQKMFSILKNSTKRISPRKIFFLTKIDFL